jgi:hypothetical protein
MDLLTEVSLRADPAGIMPMAGINPDPYQRTLLRSTADRILLLASRQIGKSTSVAFVALNEAYLHDDSLILLSSKTERQSGELHKKVQYYHKRLGLVETVRDMALTLELANGSRIIALCGEGDNFRGFSDVRLAVVDEASIVPDSVLNALLPMLIVSGGRLIAMSTPKGKLGWFFEQYTKEPSDWEKHNARAADGPRIPKHRLEEQRRSLGERLYSQEFLNEFIESEGQLFSDATIDDIINYSDCDGMMPALRGI